MKSLQTAKRIFSVVIIVCALPISIVQAADGDAFKGQAFYSVCAGCHGADAMGSEATNAPRLQGQFDWYLIRQLKLYQSGARGVHKDDTYGATMRSMAGTLANEQAIRDVVAYIGTLKSK